ncbi:MAG TPA: glycine zipper 2TM domain-containing protein [Burkholderiales bacterium]|nr:glycine zipper 2TM domain-containing protein [Burkholderiales bacterium]
MRHLKVSLIAALVATTFAGCAGMTQREKDTAVGAAIGGVGGAAVSGGNALGTLGGAAAGGFIGHEYGDDIRRKVD